MIFCLLVIAVPTIQFSIFYVGVNFNSILMAFQEYKVENDVGRYVFIGFQNFERMINELRYGGQIMPALRNSLIAFLSNIIFGTTLSLVFSFYIYKKMAFYSAFRVILFAPSIVSSIVTVLIYKIFVDSVLPAVIPALGGQGLYANPNTRMFSLLFFALWIGFGTQLLMYSGSMNTIDPSISEAAKIDGANNFIEFTRITLPLIYPTLVTFLVTNVAGLFTNQLNLYSFAGNGAGTQYMTVGYFLFRSVNLATNAELPLLATYSVTLTLIAAPITLLTRKALEKLGPSIE